MWSHFQFHLHGFANASNCLTSQLNVSLFQNLDFVLRRRPSGVVMVVLEMVVVEMVVVVEAVVVLIVLGLVMVVRGGGGDGGNGDDDGGDGDCDGSGDGRGGNGRRDGSDAGNGHDDGDDGGSSLWVNIPQKLDLIDLKWTTLEKLNKQHLSRAFVGSQLYLFIGRSVIYGRSCSV